ncbi:MAG: CoA transferase [Bacteroidota bacterium]
MLVALLKRERNGEGSLVDVSLIQAAVSSLMNQASNWLVGASMPERIGSLHPNIAPYGEWFETKDGKKTCWLLQRPPVQRPYVIYWVLKIFIKRISNALETGRFLAK